MRRIAVFLVAALVLAGCSEGDPGADGDVESLGDLVPSPVADELTESGWCDGGLLWAADASGTVAVTIEPGPDGMPAEAVLPTDAVEVTVLHGDGLGPAICTDGLDPASRSPGVQGRVEVERAMEECGSMSFRVDGLEAEDGTTFGPIEGSDAAEGCESG